ncbi:MAG: RimK family protein [Candidatus Brocadiia bacterium]
MQVQIVVSNPKYWPLKISNAEVIPAKQYLTDPRFLESRGVKVFNLCRSYRYQTTGYYVSLLAEARGHKPSPSISAIQDMKSLTIVRMVSDDLDEIIQSSLKPIQSREFTLSVYFGKNVAKRYDRLSMHLFKLFQAPFLHAEFTNNGKWHLTSIHPISAVEIPESHHDFVMQVTTEYFEKGRFSHPRPALPAYNLAILYDEGDHHKPSNPKALEKFVSAAKKVGLGCEVITKDDYGRLSEFDALFIRETTNVNHHTYRFSRRAQAEGLVVIDDPLSILRCSNKVYMAELMQLNEVPMPRTLVVHRENVKDVREKIGFPCVLKQPDGSFSGGVFRADTEAELIKHCENLFDESSLIIAQEYMPTAFDWRVGILDRKPLYVCKYYMAENHWQIIKKEKDGAYDYGLFETLRVEDAPRSIVSTAVKAANLIGDGLYGVDVKKVGRDLFVIEVNDNPSIDAGVEDAAQKDNLYIEVMKSFLRRIILSKKVQSPHV